MISKRNSRNSQYSAANSQNVTGGNCIDHEIVRIKILFEKMLDDVMKMREHSYWPHGTVSFSVQFTETEE